MPQLQCIAMPAQLQNAKKQLQAMEACDSKYLKNAKKQN
jgi:hypothetical protein